MERISYIFITYDSEKQISRQYNCWFHLFVFPFSDGHITHYSVDIYFQMDIYWSIVAVPLKLFQILQFLFEMAEFYFCFKKRNKKPTKTKTHTQDWPKLNFKLTENAEHEQITWLQLQNHLARHYAINMITHCN